jgi:hypothetical protein
MNNVYPLEVVRLAKKYGVSLEETMHWYEFYEGDLEILEEILPIRKIGRTPTREELLDCLGLNNVIDRMLN